MTWARFAIVAGIAAVVVAVTVSSWVLIAPAQAVSALCKAGFPNFSRPSAIESHTLGCTALGPHRRFTGLYVTMFEMSAFSPGSYAMAEADNLEDGAWMWPVDLDDQEAAVLRSELNRTARNMCGTGAAFVEVEGWMALSPGGYGHLNAYSRVIYVDRIVAVRSPPASVIARYREAGRTTEHSAEWCDEQERTVRN